jgi:nucleolar complex protein 2
MKKPPKASTLKSLDFATAIRAPKAYLRTRVYQDGIGEQVLELLEEFFVLWTKSIAFPELHLPVVVMLRRWLKTASSKSGGIKNSKVTSALSLLIQKLDANAAWIEERRAKVDFAPNNRVAVDAFLKDVEWEKTPFGMFVVTQRKMREEKARLVEEGRREEERKRMEEKQEKDEWLESDEEMADELDEVESSDEEMMDEDDE